MLALITDQTTAIAKALHVVGLINVQFAIKDEELYVIEANPRASRTVPFVSKAIGLPLAKLACRVQLGARLAELALPASTSNGHVCVKEAVLPFDRFAGADALLGPEMRSTGEVMGIAADFPTAFAKAQAAAGAALPESGTAFITVADSDKAAAAGAAMLLADVGFRIIATRGTAQAIRKMGLPAEAINKIGEGSPHVVDWIERGEVDLVINTPVGTGARTDGYEIRTAAIARGIPCITTMAGAIAAAGPSRPPAAERRRSARCRRSTPPRPGRPWRPAATCEWRPAATWEWRPAAAWEWRPAATLGVRHERPEGRGRRTPGLGGLRPMRSRLTESRVLAPFGRRVVEVQHRDEYGPYVVLSCADPEGPLPAAGQFYMLSAQARWGGGEDERPFLPRAFSVLRARPGRAEQGGGAYLQFMLEDVGPGTRRLCELRAGEALGLVGPLGQGLSPPPRRAAGPCSSVAAWDRAVGHLARRARLRHVDPARLP